MSMVEANGSGGGGISDAMLAKIIADRIAWEKVTTERLTVAEVRLQHTNDKLAKIDHIEQMLIDLSQKLNIDSTQISRLSIDTKDLSVNNQMLLQHDDCIWGDDRGNKGIKSRLSELEFNAIKWPQLAAIIVPIAAIFGVLGAWLVPIFGKMFK